MGISIHYSGRIADKRKLPQLIEEVQEIATVHGWKYHVYEPAFPLLTDTEIISNDLSSDRFHDGNLYGIDFTPEGSEPVAVCFLNNCRMSSIMQLACWGHFVKESIITSETEEWNANGEHKSYTEELRLDQSEYNRMLCMCSTKTQFAGPQAHELIIGFLRYISNTYLTDFKLTDEAQFWETGDTTLLQKSFDRNGFLINSFKVGLKSENRLPGEKTEDFIKRIAKGIRTKDGEE
ncbi:MAG TPA: hypothetical protein P5084_10820 [Paludibacter sp.]|nr:hypothetical protein [Paludibacter sp.]